jgi:hypothetical protein
MNVMSSVRFMPDEHGESRLRQLARDPLTRKLPDLWNVSGLLEIEIGASEPLKLGCQSPLKQALEPLTELAEFGLYGQSSWFSRVLSTALGRSNHLYYRWRGEFEAVVTLGFKDSTLGINRTQNGVKLTVLETDDQPQLEDQTFALTNAELCALPVMLWDDLDALLRLLEIDLDAREQSRWQKLRPEWSVMPA